MRYTQDLGSGVREDRHECQLCPAKERNPSKSECQVSRQQADHLLQVPSCCDSVVLAVGLSFSACLMGIGAASTREYTEHFKILRWKSWKKYEAHNFQMTHLQVNDIVVRLLPGRRAQFGAILGCPYLLPQVISLKGVQESLLLTCTKP